MRQRRGYLAAWLGASPGLAMLVALLGALFYVLDREEAIGPIIVGVGGAALAAVLGSHGALRWRRHPSAGATAWTLAAVLVVSALAAIAGPKALRTLWTLEVLVTPLIARWLAVRRAGAERRRDEEI